LPATGANGFNPASFALSLFGASANRFLNLEISALEADGKGKVVSSPRVITADQQKALIEQGEELPYQVATSSGATSLQFRKANLKLEVTPQVTPEGNVILDVDITKDSVGRATTAGFAINTKHVKTQVLVENGGTVVIGGIFEQSDREDVTKVPCLGDVPYLGNLFKTRTIDHVQDRAADLPDAQDRHRPHCSALSALTPRKLASPRMNTFAEVLDHDGSSPSACVAGGGRRERGNAAVWQRYWRVLASSAPSAVRQLRYRREPDPAARHGQHPEHRAPPPSRPPLPRPRRRARRWPASRSRSRSTTARPSPNRRPRPRPTALVSRRSRPAPIRPNRLITVTATSGALATTRTFVVTGSFSRRPARPIVLPSSANNQIIFRLTNANGTAIANQPITIDAGVLGTTSAVTDTNGNYTYTTPRPRPRRRSTSSARQAGSRRSSPCSCSRARAGIPPAAGGPINSLPCRPTRAWSRPTPATTNNAPRIRALFVGRATPRSP
jgi:hypothetical protein